ncbi:MAG: hypothetical protein LBJ64_03320, partial [Deltaproteobacteria bacterium]|nr:hypothetical protein [Deltaproteobacteria bacterium]
MPTNIVVRHPMSVSLLKALMEDHPELKANWVFDANDKTVVVEGADRLAMTVENGLLVRLDLTDPALKGALKLYASYGLEHLHINCPQVTELEIECLWDLASLSVENLSFSGLSGELSLDGLPKLSHLQISRSGLSDLAPLKHLSSLKTLDLSHNAIQSA